MGNMKLNLKIWRQQGPNDKGQMKDYPVSNVSEDMSFLETVSYTHLTLPTSDLV